MTNSPVALIIAIMLDAFGFICLILTFTIGAEIGESISLIPDILGLVVLGGRELFISRRRAISRAGQVKAKVAAKTGGKRGLKFLLSFVGELVPFIGAFPFWTGYVLSEKGEESSHSYEDEENT